MWFMLLIVGVQHLGKNNQEGAWGRQTNDGKGGTDYDLSQPQGAKKRRGGGLCWLEGEMA